jgi:cytochrome b561
MDQVSVPSPALFHDQKHAAIRIWHWLTFLFFLASLTTVLLGSTVFRTRNNIGLVQEQIAAKGGTVTPDQARSVAHEFSDKLWMLHKYIGYGLSLLLLFRIITECLISKQERLSVRMRNAMNYPRQSAERTHYLFVHYGYLIFYILFLLMALTGLVLAFEDVRWLDPLHKAAKNIHSIVQYGLYVYILFHIGGVIRADLTSYNGIVSRMIHGKATSI